jgi:hypothetical protein
MNIGPTIYGFKDYSPFAMYMNDPPAVVILADSHRELVRPETTAAPTAPALVTS